MTLAQAQQLAIDSLSGACIGSLLVGPVLIRVQLTDRHVSRTRYYRFDYYRNKLDFPGQTRKLTKAMAAALLADDEVQA